MRLRRWILSWHRKICWMHCSVLSWNRAGNGKKIAGAGLNLKWLEYAGVIGVQSVKVSLMVAGMVTAETDRRKRRAARLAEQLVADPAPDETPGRAMLRARLLQRQRDREARA